MEVNDIPWDKYNYITEWKGGAAKRGTFRHYMFEHFAHPGINQGECSVTEGGISHFEGSTKPKWGGHSTILHDALAAKAVVLCFIQHASVVLPPTSLTVPSIVAQGTGAVVATIRMYTCATILAWKAGAVI